MPSIARTERRALADLLADVGPDASTLCDGWTTRLLAAHLVVRERRPDATVGLAVSALAGRTESIQKHYATKPYAELVELVRTGPGRLSPFALPGVDTFLNTTEYVVHHEDVRRAQPGWEPRRLPPAVQKGLWQTVSMRSKLAFRRGVDAGVVLRRSDVPDEQVVATNGAPVATITGEPLELLLYIFGRRAHARVEITGDPAARVALAGASLAVSTP